MPAAHAPWSDTGAAAVEVVDLVKEFGSVTAVAGISFRLARGTITALLGGNGAGKTTTIAMLMGLIVPTSGSVRVLGADMARDRHKVLHRINFESPYADIPMRMTVRENLDVFGRIYGVAELARQLRQVAQELRIEELLERPYGKLSAGQKTRVSLAKALLNRPEVLLLDEPTASLDPDTADWVRSHIEAYAREAAATIVLASHNMGEVERLAGRVIMLERGRILADAPPDELIRRYGRTSLEEVFLAIARRSTEGSVEPEAAPLLQGTK
ncbi:MAG: ABC transporter ATP-binding protein [Hyphomicrobiaceae bacterium]|nr:ABC transporter ATP-binding protein [Hyphomicrobiaceae bacterium]